MAFLPISFLACLLEPGVVERPLPAWSANSPCRPLSPAHVGSLGPFLHCLGLSRTKVPCELQGAVITSVCCQLSKDLMEEDYGHPKSSLVITTTSQ